MYLTDFENFSSAILVTFGNLVAAQDAIEEKKVPPRRPDQRLNTLKRFAENWIDSQLRANLNRPQRAINKKRAFNRIFDRALEAYNKCGYFDPTVLPHGGPRPEGKLLWFYHGCESIFRYAKT